jgi:hypothetical protein
VMLVDNLIGAVFYFKLLSHPIRWLTAFAEHLFTRLLSLLFWPFRRFLMLLAVPLSFFWSHLKKIIKKIFSFPARWFTMIKIPKKATSNAGQSSENEGGQQHVQNQKGWSSD